MKRRRTTSGVPGSLRSQSSRPDFGELVRLLGTAAEENNPGLFFDYAVRLSSSSRSHPRRWCALVVFDASCSPGEATLRAVRHSIAVKGVDRVLRLPWQGFDCVSRRYFFCCFLSCGGAATYIRVRTSAPPRFKTTNGLFFFVSDETILRSLPLSFFAT